MLCKLLIKDYRIGYLRFIARNQGHGTSASGEYVPSLRVVYKFVLLPQKTRRYKI